VTPNTVLARADTARDIPRDSGEFVSDCASGSLRHHQNHNLDVTYPNRGFAEVLVDAKMLGAPNTRGAVWPRPTIALERPTY
jgi:hypothetical protein